MGDADTESGVEYDFDDEKKNVFARNILDGIGMNLIKVSRFVSVLLVSRTVLSSKMAFRKTVWILIEPLVVTQYY